jgi:hypothetical protein
MKQINRSPVNRSRITCFPVAVALFLSCAGEEEPARDATTATRFTVDTRAVPEGTTYRVMTYETSYAFNQDATYYFNSSNGNELTACNLDANGENPTTPGTGLTGIAGNFFILCVSPGVQHTAGGFTFDPANEEFRAVMSTPRMLGNYALIDLGRLLDRRVKVEVNFYKRKHADDFPDVEDFTIQDETVSLEGAGAGKGTFTIYPATRQVIPLSGVREIALTPTDPLNDFDEEDNPQFYSTATPVHIASAIYAPKEEVARTLKISNLSNLKESGYLYMTCTLVQGMRTIPLRLPLTNTLKDADHELKPQHFYRFKITVMSNYINAVMEVFDQTSNDWQGVNAGGTIGAPSDTVQLGNWAVNEVGEWEQVRYQGQAIPYQPQQP